MLALGPADGVRLEEAAVGVGASSSGLLVAVATARSVALLGCGAGLDWVLLGSCARPLGAGRHAVDLAWSPDESAVALCDGMGAAELYEVRDAGVGDALRLAAPAWAEVSAFETVSRSGSIRTLRLKCRVTHAVDGEPFPVYSAASASRLWLWMGTARGSAVRVLWTGEIAKDTEVDLTPRSGVKVSIRALSVGRRQRVGFLSATGACGYFTKEKAVHTFVERDARSIALRRAAPTAVVGMQSGSVRIYTIGDMDFQALEDVLFPFQEIPYHLEMKRRRRKRNGVSELASATVVRWCPDSSPFFVVGYDDVGYIVWSCTGRKMTQLFVNEVIAKREDERFVPVVEWALRGYNLMISPTFSSPKGEKFKRLSILQIVKSSAATAQIISGSTSMCMHGWNYILALRNQEWDLQTLAWRKLEFPSIFSLQDLPIRSIAVSLNGMYPAIATKSKIALYSHASRHWTLFEDSHESASLDISMLFWWGDEILCAVNREMSSRKFELLCFSRESLSLDALLGRVELQGKPIAVDTNFNEGILVFLLDKILCVFHFDVARLLGKHKDELNEGSEEEDGEDSAPGRGNGFLGEPSSSSSTSSSSSKKLYVIRRAASSAPTVLATIVNSVGLRMVASVPIEFEAPLEYVESFCVMPCGATRRAGVHVKFPKCAVLSSLRKLYVVDTDEGHKNPITSDVHRIIPQSWHKIDQSDDVVLDSYLERSLRIENGFVSDVPKLPAVLLYTIWIVDKCGLRLWLPAIDINGDFLETRCTEDDRDVYPLGIMETHGLVIGIMQRSRTVSARGLMCYEFTVRATPTTHGILRWLLQAERTDLASQVLVQASTHLPLFRETLDLFLFHAVETDYLTRNNPQATRSDLLKKAASLLRKGKVAAILDSRSYDSLIITCARKMEPSRWDIFFASAGDPEQIFNDAIYAGDLRTAAGSMIIADEFSPEKSARRIAALTEAAELHNDAKLIAEIKHFKTTKLVNVQNV